jgi:hypothetical protein
MAMPRLGTIRVVLLLAMLAGCARSSEPPNTTQPQTPPTTAVMPPTTASEGPQAAELVATGENLPPGPYTRSSFEPRIRLELDGSWEAVQLTDGFFDVQKLAGTPDVIAVQFANVIGVVGATEVVEPENAATAVDILSENEALTVLETSSSRLGGLVGSQVTIENQNDGHARVLEVPPGMLGIDPGRRLWIAFFDTDQGLLSVMVGGSTAQWDLALIEAEPVLESIVVGP